MYKITNSTLKSSVYSALAAQTREFRQRISFGEWRVSGASRNFAAEKTYEKGIIKLDISQQGNSDGSGLVMGCCCSSSCTAEFYNLDKTYNYHGKIMFVECGIKLSNDSFFYIPCGYYKIENPKTDDDWSTVTLTAYDDVDRMGEKWTSALTYPSTAYLVLKEITDKYGIELDIDIGVSTVLKSRTITESEALTLTSYTEREVCGFIAGLAGANARMSSVGALRIAWYTEQPSDYTVSIPAELQWQNGFKKTTEKAFAINSITSGIEDAVFTAGTGTGISFANPIITEAEITAIYEKYGGMSFQPCTCEWRGNPCLECGDIVTVTDRNNIEYNVFIANQNVDLTGGLSMLIECPGGDADISFDTVDERTRAALNRQYTTLQQAIAKTTNVFSSTTGGAFKVIDTNDDGIADAFRLTSTSDGELFDDTKVVLGNYEGIACSANGEKTFKTAITGDGIVGGAIIANSVTATQINLASVVNGIENSGLVFSRGTISGLDTELANIFAMANAANTAANSALDTAEVANTKAESAQTAVGEVSGNLSTLEEQIASYALGNKLTYISDTGIYTGSITAQQINVGWGGANYAADNTWSGNTNYFSIKTDSSTYLPKLSMSTSYTGGEVRLTLNTPFYVAKGASISASAIAKVIGSSASTSYVGIGIMYSSTPDGGFSLAAYSSTLNKSLSQEHEITVDYISKSSGYYKIDIWFNRCQSGSYATNITATQSVKGSMIVNGIIKSKDGLSYFDLDNSEFRTGTADYYTSISSGAISQYGKSSGKKIGSITPVASGQKYFYAMSYNSLDALGLSLGAESNGEHLAVVEIKTDLIKFFNNNNFYFNEGGIILPNTKALYGRNANSNTSYPLASITSGNKAQYGSSGNSGMNFMVGNGGYQFFSDGSVVGSLNDNGHFVCNGGIESGGNIFCGNDLFIPETGGLRVYTNGTAYTTVVKRNSTTSFLIGTTTAGLEIDYSSQRIWVWMGGSKVGTIYSSGIAKYGDDLLLDWR